MQFFTLLWCIIFCMDMCASTRTKSSYIHLCIIISTWQPHQLHSTQDFYTLLCLLSSHSMLLNCNSSLLETIQCFYKINNINNVEHGDYSCLDMFAGNLSQNFTNSLRRFIPREFVWLLPIFSSTSSPEDLSGINQIFLWHSSPSRKFLGHFPHTFPPQGC